MRIRSHLRVFKTVLLCAGGVMVNAFQQAPVEVRGAELALVDEDVARVQQLLSHQPNWSRPAPRVWSSRLDVRWSARWQSAPKYAA